MRSVYLDHAATTPLDPRVLEAMRPYLTDHYGNPSSLHRLGRQARFAIDEARDRVAARLGAAASEVVFTSGGTEADNLALRGSRGVLVTSTVEHEAVLRTTEALEATGREVRLLAPGPEGAVSADQIEVVLEEAPGPATVSLMHANNEIGTLTDLPSVAEICRRHDAVLHTDAVQTAGLYRLDVDALGVDVLSLSGHKFYGPKGVGALYIRGGVELGPLVTGGSQERARRGGTENVAGVVGLAAALDLAHAAAEERLEHLRRLQQRLRRSLREALDVPFVENTPAGEAAAPHILNIAFPPDDDRPLDGEMLLLNLDLEGVMASAGSACTSGALSPSHVLSGLGLDRATASAALRFSLGKDTTEAEVDYAVEALRRVLRRMVGARVG